MSKIPCKKCKSCGFYHDLSVDACNECGKDLRNIPAFILETEDIPGEQYGEIDETVAVYVQKCSACGALNFTADKKFPAKMCHNCHKTRIAAIEPVEYVNKDSYPDNNDNSSVVENDAKIISDATGEKSRAKATVLFDDDDDDDDDDNTSPWSGMLGSIRRSVRGSEPAVENNIECQQKEAPRYEVSDDDDDEDVSGWFGILGGNPESKKAAVAHHKPAITLTAIRYGRLSFTIEAKANEEYMLGRSANQSEFLRSDGRVGNEHCYLYFKSGSWYVKDNHSLNGTAVNSRDLGLNGESKLNDGDELKLGHHTDSMAFIITI